MNNQNIFAVNRMAGLLSVPPNLQPSSQRGWVQLRIAHNLHFAYVGGWLIYVMFYVFLHAYLSASICMLGALSSVYSFYLLRANGQIVKAGLISSVASATVLFLATFTTGGVDSPVGSWFTAMIIAAYMQLGMRRGSYVTLYIIVLMILVSLVASVHRNSLYELPFPIGTPWYVYGCYILSGLVSAGIIGLFVKYFEEGYQALQDSEERAMEASLAKSTFLANMSHEIRTPLNAITGMTHLVRRSGVTPEQAERLDKLQSASSHLMNIINDILDLSKIEAGRLRLEEARVNIEALVMNVVSMTQERATKKGLRLSTRIAPIPCALQGDATRLQQVLLNFVGNAIKFTEHGGVIVGVQLQHEDTEFVKLRFEVEDTGIGIATEDFARLFTAFEQADTSTTRKFGGTGLGLAINKRLAEMMGGEVGVNSAAGEGSVFWFTVRLKKGDEQKKAKVMEGQADDEAALRKLHAGRSVLLVEDEPINREVALMMLDDVGLVVDVAVNGAEAVDRVRQNRYDLILMDMQMPVMDGLTATRVIRQLPNGKHVPILALTANAFVEDRAACLNAGMDDFTSKPIEPTQLYACLLTWLNTQGETD